MNSGNDIFGSDQTRSFSVLTPGMAVSHYRIVKIIGSGGMGDVYLAEDTKLKRKVALKFLSARFTSDQDLRDRFVREAEATAKLNHPNVITIHEVGEFQGRPFFAMELVEGQSISDMAKDKDLSIDRIVELTIQICDGLAAAHEKKVVHRDIKPANIIIDSHGRPKILDFGLAAVQGSAQLTKTGSTLGTIRYMSPEQVSGRDVDHRSDLFSLGIVLYELITGRTPFRHENEGAMFKAIMEDNPEPLTRYKSDVPDNLQQIVCKLLEKDRELRYQSAEGVIADLKHLMYDSQQTGYKWTAASKPKKTRFFLGIAAAVVILIASFLYFALRPSDHKVRVEEKDPMIAVLPFENLGSPDDQYFADGMTEEITSRLAGIKGLGVISRTSSAKFRESDKTLQEIGRDYGVDFVLEGSVRWSKAGDHHKVRITPQLIRVSDDRHMWADNYERALIEVFAVQADIAEKIVAQLGLTLVEKDRQNLASMPTENPEAYKYYLKALQKIRRRSDYSDSKTAQAALDSAVALDPSFALAHALRSEAYADGAGGDPESEGGIIALEAAERSLELQSGLPQGHLALGKYYYFVQVDYDRALEQFLMAESELYNDPELLHVISIVQIQQGKFKEALENRSKAAELDPLNARRHAAHAAVLQSLRRFTEAEESINRAIALEPEIQTYYEDKVDCLIAHYGDIEKVKPIISEALEHCDTTEFVIKNSWITRYIPDLKTDSIISDYILKEKADTSKVHLFADQPSVWRKHLDILEDYDDEARKRAKRYESMSSDAFIDWQGLLHSFLGECDRAIECGLRAKELTSIHECDP